MIYNGLNQTQAFSQRWGLSEDRKWTNEGMEVMRKEQCFGVSKQSDKKKCGIMRQQEQEKGQERCVSLRWSQCESGNVLTVWSLNPENAISSFAEEKKLTQRYNSHALWKKMQLELNEQVHQYDADTWGEQNEYSGQIHPHRD